MPGHEFSGEIEAVGKEVAKWKKGDNLFDPTTGFTFCGSAEFICLPEKSLMTSKLDNKTHEEIVSVPVGGMTALYLLKKAYIKREQKIHVYDAFGSVASYAVQLANYNYILELICRFLHL